MRAKSDLRSAQQRTVTALYEGVWLGPGPSTGTGAVLPMGGGKTASALTAFEELKRDGEARDMFVLAPKRVAQLVWRAEVRQWAHLQRLKVVFVGGSSAKRADSGRKGLLFDRARTRNETVTYERLRQLLHYNPDSGLFTWLMRTSNRVRVGDIAGCVGKDDGYVRLSIDGVLYLGHRLAWFYMTQEWPPVDADHENRVTSDNRWLNLRPATRGQNSNNQRKRRHGLKGCHQKPNGRWISSITHKKLPKGYAYLGSYDTEQEAHDAYCREAVRLSGEYARFE